MKISELIFFGTIIAAILFSVYAIIFYTALLFFVPFGVLILAPFSIVITWFPDTKFGRWLNRDFKKKK